MPMYRGACPHDCPDTCAWQVTVDDDGSVSAFSGDRDHPITAGALCSKLKRYPSRVASPDRVIYPLRRAGPKGSGQFERIGWDEAISEITDRLRHTLDEYGPLSAMPCNFAGTLGLLNRYAGDRFFGRLGAAEFNVQICGELGYEGIGATLGPGENMDPEDFVDSRYIVVWGANPAVTNVHLWGGYILKARRNGAKVVVIDPIRSQTAAHSDWHIRLRPGTDAALALGIMHVIVRDGLTDDAFIRQHTTGFDQLVRRVEEYPPERVEAITGVSCESIATIAHEFATTTPSAIKVTIGMERHANGFDSYRAVSCLPALVGSWKARGGGILHATNDAFFEAIDFGAVLPPADLRNRGRTIHAAKLGKALTATDPGKTPITWLMVYNFNPLVSLPNQNLVIKGLMREDLFTVVHEHFMTDTARYADIVLPATMQFEHLDLMPSWGHFYISLNTPALTPRGECISNTELFRRLAESMGYTESWLFDSDEEKVRALLDSGSPLIEGITYDYLAEHGWAKLNVARDRLTRANGGFNTPSGKCEFFSDSLRNEGCDPLPCFTVPETSTTTTANFPLQLITPKAPHFLNSEYVNTPHKGTAKMRPEIQINPKDASVRGISDGDEVLVYNQLGSVELYAKVSDAMDTGLVCCPFNWWTSSTLNGSSLSALTPDGLSRRGFGSNAFDARVEIISKSDVT